MSIQTQILGVAEPYFNEGFGHEGMRNSAAGKEGSIRYNNTLRLATLRHAVIDHLKSPPRGFEEVTKRHFSMCRKRLLVQARSWMAEAEGLSIHSRFVRAYNELVVLLSADGLKDFAGYNDVLPPSDQDVERLRAVDQTFITETFGSVDEIKLPAQPAPQQPAARPAAAVDRVGETVTTNPWANIPGNGEMAVDNDDTKPKAEGDDPDDELYE